MRASTSATRLAALRFAEGSSIAVFLTMDIAPNMQHGCSPWVSQHGAAIRHEARRLIPRIAQWTEPLSSGVAPGLPAATPSESPADPRDGRGLTALPLLPPRRKFRVSRRFSERHLARLGGSHREREAGIKVSHLERQHPLSPRG